jgi:hypothetical protein
MTKNGLVKPARLNSLMKEGDEVIAIVVASAKTTRSSQSRSVGS